VAEAKRAFRIGVVLRRVRAAVAAYPKAAMFELAERGYASTFQQLIGCMLSIRTRDETSLPAALRLFERAPDAATVARLGVARIDALIGTVAFHRGKAEQIREIARRAVRDHDGLLPCDYDVLTSLPGVGPKCAHLALGIACGHAGISVDIHVHRVTNRWGYVHARTPERTLVQLNERLPRRYWIDLNALLVPFGKHICTGRRPKCSSCPVLEYCKQIGVTRHR
jgi:endonuclease III